MALLFWLAGLWLSGPILSSSHFPSEDGPAYLYWTSVYRDVGADVQPLATIFERNARWNSPNLAYFALQYGLSGWLEPHVAQRVILLALLFCWVGSIYLLSLATVGRLTLGSFAALLLFHNWALYMGFFSFLFGIPCFVYGVAVLARILDPAEHPASWRYVLVGALALLAYYLHLVPGVLLTGSIVFAALVGWRSAPTRARRLLLAAVPSILIIVGFVVASPFGQGGVGWAVKSVIKRFLGFAFWRGFAVPDVGFWLTLLLFACTCLALTGLALRSWRRGQVSYGARFVMQLAGCLLLVYLLAPMKIGIGSFLNDRIQLALWVVLLPVLGVSLARRVETAMAAVLVLLFAWQGLDFSMRAHRFGRELESLVTAAEAIPRGSTIDYVQPYEASRIEGSFVAPFMDGGEVAYHCGCALVGNYWQNSPFYWVRTRPDEPKHVDFLVSFDRKTGAVPTLRVEPAPR